MLFNVNITMHLSTPAQFLKSDLKKMNDQSKNVASIFIFGG